MKGMWRNYAIVLGALAAWVKWRRPGAMVAQEIGVLAFIGFAFLLHGLVCNMERALREAPPPGGGGGSPGGLDKPRGTQVGPVVDGWRWAA